MCDASFAYVDPGTGSLIIQWVFGMAVASLAVGNIYWHRFKQFLSGKSSRADSTPKAEASDDAGSE
jgi:hypothetical protein